MPLKSRWTPTEDGLVHARVSIARGTGRPPVVLVPGLGVSSRYMAPTAEVLARDLRVFAIDLPGFGLSEKPDRVLGVPQLARALAGWLETERLEPAVVIANSFGCQVVAELALASPGLVDRVVFLAPTVDPDARSAPRQAARWMLTVPFEPPSLQPVVVRDYRQAGISRIRQTARFALEDRIETRLPRIVASVLVVRGEHDRVVPRRWAERAAGSIPDGRLATIRGGAHCLNFGAPVQVAELVHDFVRG